MVGSRLCLAGYLLFILQKISRIFVYNLIEKLTLVGYNFSVCVVNLNVALSECHF